MTQSKHHSTMDNTVSTTISEAHQWVEAGAEANPDIVFQAIVDGQLITSEIPPATRELWCDEMPPVWDTDLS